MANDCLENENVPRSLCPGGHIKWPIEQTHCGSLMIPTYLGGVVHALTFFFYERIIFLM